MDDGEAPKPQPTVLRSRVRKHTKINRNEVVYLLAPENREYLFYPNVFMTCTVKRVI